MGCAGTGAVQHSAAGRVAGCGLRARGAGTDVGPLLLDVDLAHVNLALELHQRGRGGERDAVLSRARLRDDLALAHALSKKRLAEAVVDLVGARVVKVLAPGVVERRWNRRKVVEPAMVDRS